MVIRKARGLEGRRVSVRRLRTYIRHREIKGDFGISAQISEQNRVSG